MIPLVVYASAQLYDRDVWIPPRVLFADIAEKQLLPLLVGLALMYFAAGFASSAFSRRSRSPAMFFCWS